MAVRGHRLLLALLGVLAVAVAAMVIPAFVCRPADPKLDTISTVPAFALIDERGQPFTDAGLRGHVSIVDFVFTRCDAICPLSTMKMEKIQDKTFDIGDRVKLVSFSVDPEYDTPARLAEYAKKYRADGERWRFITGPLAQIQALVEGPFMINMQRKGETPAEHRAPGLLPARRSRAPRPRRVRVGRHPAARRDDPRRALPRPHRLLRTSRDAVKVVA